VRYLIGVGNYAGFDDSIGLRVAEAIAERGLDRDFTAIEIGGNALDLVHYLNAETESVLIVDCALMGLEPGEYGFFAPEQVATRKSLPGLSTHEADVLKVVELVASLGEALPTITMLGIEPEAIRVETGLSRRLEERFEEYVRAAVGFFGVEPE
jgi:hydrogenase maturation protease